MAHFFELNCLWHDSEGVYTASRIINIDHISYWRSINSRTFGSATEVWLDGEVCLTISRDEHCRLRRFLAYKGCTITYKDDFRDSGNITFDPRSGA